MNLFSWLESALHKMRWFDLSLVKLSTAAFILMVASLWPIIASLQWWAYLILGGLFAARPLMVLLSVEK